MPLAFSIYIGCVLFLWAQWVWACRQRPQSPLYPWPRAIASGAVWGVCYPVVFVALVVALVIYLLDRAIP